MPRSRDVRKLLVPGCPLSMNALWYRPMSWMNEPQRVDARRTLLVVALSVVVAAGACRSPGAPAPAATPAVSAPAPVPTSTAFPFEGFGASTRGGADGRDLRVTDVSTKALREVFSRARTGNVTIHLPENAKIVLEKMLPQVTGSGVTIEGNGATIDGSRLEQDVALLDIRGHDVIVRNLRLRNGYDNLRVKGPEAFNVVIDHVSSTGARDDGMTITHGAHDVTVQYSYLAGNTRGLFSKYDGTHNVSVHHTLLQKNWMRSPLFDGTTSVDMRNVIVEDWGLWGARFEGGASGNIVASLFTLSRYATSIGGKKNSALWLKNPAAVYAADNVFRDQATTGTSGEAAAPHAAPTVQTSTVAEMEPVVRARAGCLPRDNVDRAYLGLRQGWKVTESEPFRVRLE